MNDQIPQKQLKEASLDIESNENASTSPGCQFSTLGVPLQKILVTSEFIEK